MRITIDIETIPGQQPGLRESFLEDARNNIRPPSSKTKDELAAQLGITDAAEIKFTAKDAMLAAWVSRFANEAAAEQAEDAWRKTSFNGALGQICVIGYAIEDQEPVALYAADYENGDAGLLRDFFAAITDLRCDGRPVKPMFIGHNLAAFDLPFIFHRAVINGVPLPAGFPIHPKPWGDECFDTMTYWAGPKDRISLDNLCRALGIEGKGGMDGSQVWDFVRAGRIAEVADYCKHDIEITRAAYKRLTFQEAA